MNNRLLQITHRLLLLSTFFTLLLIVLFVVVIVFELADSTFFRQWMVTDSNGSFHFEISSLASDSSSLYEGSILGPLFQSMFIVIAWLMVQLNALKVFRALKDSETFHLNSIKALRTVGFWLLVITAIEFLQFKWIENSLQMTFNFELTYLIAACSAMVLAQIFKEGNELAETNRLTI
jgi:hypothetical protein